MRRDVVRAALDNETGDAEQAVPLPGLRWAPPRSP